VQRWVGWLRYTLPSQSHLVLDSFSYAFFPAPSNQRLANFFHLVEYVMPANAKVSGNWGLKRSGSPQLSAGLPGYARYLLHCNF
jgi:hypothetical protein